MQCKQCHSGVHISGEEKEKESNGHQIGHQAKSNSSAVGSSSSSSSISHFLLRYIAINHEHINLVIAIITRLPIKKSGVQGGKRRRKNEREGETDLP